jgi:hypothetical protein
LVRFLSVVSAALLLAAAPNASAQSPVPLASPQQAAAADAIGSVASLQGSATVTRGNTNGALKVDDDIFRGDIIQTASNATLGITLDDDTTFTMGGNARMVMDEFLYQSGGKPAATYNVVRGTLAFVAGQVARTGDMSIATPTATIGIRGTTGVVEVPEGVTTAGQVAVKLYPDASGAVGRIELFAPGPGGARLGVLTRASTGFGIGAGIAGRFAAVPLAISSQQVARDRGFVRQLFSHQTLGRQLVFQRRPFRMQALPPNVRQNLQRNFQRQNLQRQNLPQDLRRRTPSQDLQRRPQDLPPNLRGPSQPGGPQRGELLPRFDQRALPRVQQPAVQGAPALRRQLQQPQQVPGHPPRRGNERQQLR